VHHLFPDLIAKHREVFLVFTLHFIVTLRLCGPGGKEEDRRELSKRQMKTTMIILTMIILTVIILTVIIQIRTVLIMYIVLCYVDRASRYNRVKKIQLDAQLDLSIFRQPLHVSGLSRPIIRRYNRMYTTIGTYYSF
jgi:hypothetical protein